MPLIFFFLKESVLELIPSLRVKLLCFLSKMPLTLLKNSNLHCQIQINCVAFSFQIALSNTTLYNILDYLRRQAPCSHLFWHLTKFSTPSVLLFVESLCTTTKRVLKCLKGMIDHCITPKVHCIFKPTVIQMGQKIQMIAA